MRTEEELRKEINGKLVVWTDKDTGIGMDAICLWEPGNSVTSIKPYGLSPSEILESLVKAGFESYNIDKVSRRDFCFAELKFNKEKTDRFEVFNRLADIPEGGAFIFEDVTHHAGMSMFGPSCPY